MRECLGEKFVYISDTKTSHGSPSTGVGADGEVRRPIHPGACTKPAQNMNGPLKDRQDPMTRSSLLSTRPAVTAVLTHYDGA